MDTILNESDVAAIRGAMEFLRGDATVRSSIPRTGQIEVLKGWIIHERGIPDCADGGVRRFDRRRCMRNTPPQPSPDWVLGLFGFFDRHHSRDGVHTLEWLPRASDSVVVVIMHRLDMKPVVEMIDDFDAGRARVVPCVPG